jgi:large subunit ribosomal protein L20
MPRTKTGVTRRHRHKKVLDHNKGFRGANSRLYKRAKEAQLHSDQYAYVGRKLRKRDFRRLWIVRIKAALQALNESFKYSRFIKALKDANIQIDRKIMSDLAVSNPEAFKAIVDKSGLAK